MRASIPCLLFLAFVVSCAVPKRDYTPEQIMKETSFDELMHVQATVADPRFKLAKGLDAGEISANDFEEFIDMGRRLQFTSKRIAQIAKSDFGGLNKQLGSQAAALEKQASAGQGESVLRTVRAIEKTCQQCHAEYR